MNKKIEQRLRRKTRARFYIKGTDERPRLNVFRSNKHIYAQVINDRTGVTLAHVGTLSEGVKGVEGGMVKRATAVGKALAVLCVEKGIKKVVFDKNGFIYKKGGTIDALATGAREGGLDF